MAHQFLLICKSCALKEGCLGSAVCKAFAQLTSLSISVYADEGLLHINLPQGNAVLLEQLSFMGFPGLEVLTCSINNLDSAKHLTKLVLHDVNPENFVDSGWPADMANLHHIQTEGMTFPIPQEFCNYSKLRVLEWNRCTADTVPLYYSDLTQLKTLQCQEAEFGEVLPIMRLSQLEVLDLAQGNLLQANESFLQLADWPCLKYIDLSLKPEATEQYHLNCQLWLGRLRKALNRILRRHPDCEIKFE